MDVAELQKRIDAIPWYHEFDFGNGLRTHSQTPDIEVHRRIWRLIEDGLAEIDFQDKTVLDVGCWDGYWSFYAERRGAKNVLAVDDFSQNWANESGLLLAKELLRSRVQTQTRRSVYDLASLGQKFDVILMLGVHYHLLDPFYALAQLRHCCHPETVLCLEGNESINLPENSAALDLTQHWGKFSPTAGYLRQLLSATYFSVSAERFLEPDKYVPRPASGKWRWRMVQAALLRPEAKVREIASRLVVPPPEIFKMLRRVFLVCRAFEGENPIHLYPPPFGLDAYDPRFKTPARSA